MTTPDGNALVVSVEEYLRLRPQLGNLELVVNRAYDGVRTAVDELEARFGAQASALELARSWRSVEESQPIGRLFRRGSMEVCGPQDALARTLRLSDG